MFVLTIILIVGPLTPLIYQAFTDKPLYDSGESFTFGNFANVFSSSTFRTATLNSLLFAIIATVISQVLGSLQAILLSRTNMPGRRLIGTVVLWPLFISPLVIAFGWNILYGRAGYATSFFTMVMGYVPWNTETIFGMALIAGILNAPITFLYCKGAMALSDSSVEKAAKVCGARPMTILRRVTLPLLLPSIVISGAINFTSALESLSIPLIFGEPAGITLLMPLLYKQALRSATPDYGLVAAAALCLLAVVALLIWLQSRFLGDTRKYNSVSGKSSRQDSLDLGRLRWPAAIFLGAFVVIFVLLPMGAIFLRGFVSVLTPLIPIHEVLTLQNFVDIAQSEKFRRAVFNSLILATFGGAIIAVFTMMVAIVAYRSDFRFRKQLEYVAMIPRAVPGMIAGIAFLYTILIVPGFGALRTTLVIFVIGYTARFLPTALGAIFPNLAQIGPDLDRSSRTMGADWWTTMRRIVLPLMLPSLLSAYVLIFVQSIREYSMALFLVAPGSEVISISLLQAWAQGEVGKVAAMSVVQTVIIATAVFLSGKLLKSKVGE
jgi:iron(III) transport system permease protein